MRSRRANWSRSLVAQRLRRRLPAARQSVGKLRCRRRHAKRGDRHPALASFLPSSLMHAQSVAALRHRVAVGSLVFPERDFLIRGPNFQWAATRRWPLRPPVYGLLGPPPRAHPRRASHRRTSIGTSVDKGARSVELAPDETLAAA